MYPRRQRTQYGRYHDGPDPLALPVDLQEALSAIGEDVMAGYSPERAMQEFLRRGGNDQVGLDELARRVQQRRNDLLRRHNLDGTMADIKQLLDEAVLAERKQLARDLDDEARFAEMQLAELPSSPAAAVSQLANYDWRSSEGREKYEEIKDLLGRELLDQHFQGMKQALENATDEDRAAVQEMLSDLNELLEKHARGDDTEQDFADFMAKHGQHFPEQPENIDELIDALAKRAAAAQRMLNSMSPEQRAELMQLAQEAFGSPELMDQLSRLDSNLQAMRPGEDWTGSQRFSGEEGLGLGDGTGALQDLADLDDLAEQLSQSYPGARLDDIDLDALRRQFGNEGAVAAETLRELEKALKDSGYLNRASDGSLKLTPQAMRRLGKQLLKDAAQRLSGRQGQRDTRLAGAAGEQTGASREWQFGDTEPWDVTGTISNAVHRTVTEGGDPAEGLRIDVRDITVTETEARTRSAVALLVDTSFSMVMDGRWVPMKRTALALHSLINTRFRGDRLELITFGRHARTTTIDELTGLEPWFDKGTNLHHGLLLANRFFRKHSNEQPVLLIVTDGEPTSHLMPDGQVLFSYPPHPATISVTVEELEASGRLGARVTFFRLGTDPGLARFTEQMARRVDGTVINPELDDLGAAVVGSYLGSRGTSPAADFGWGDRGWWVD